MITQTDRRKKHRAQKSTNTRSCASWVLQDFILCHVWPESTAQQGRSDGRIVWFQIWDVLFTFCICNIFRQPWAFLALLILRQSILNSSLYIPLFFSVFWCLLPQGAIKVNNNQVICFVSGVPSEFSYGITPDADVQAAFRLVLSFTSQYDIYFPQSTFLNKNLYYIFFCHFPSAQTLSGMEP